MTTPADIYLETISKPGSIDEAEQLGQQAAEDYLASKPRRLSALLGKIGAVFNTRLAQVGVASVALIGSAACVGQDSRELKEPIQAPVGCYHTAGPDDESVWDVYTDRTDEQPNTQAWYDMNKQNRGLVVVEGAEIFVPAELCFPEDYGTEDDKEAGADKKQS